MPFPGVSVCAAAYRMYVATVFIVTSAALCGAAFAQGYIFDDFHTVNTSLWEVADRQYVDNFAPVYYLRNHSATGAAGLAVTISDDPCRSDPGQCHGAAMASDHWQSTTSQSYEARLRAPHVPGSSKCPDGVYGYFTAGFVKTDAYWNEVNFGFHPDRDEDGSRVV